MQGFLLLERCINAEFTYRALLNEYHFERERMIYMQYPSYETESGRIERRSVRVDNIAVYLLEVEEKIRQEMKPLHHERQLLKQALNTLTDREKEAFNAIVWGERKAFHFDSQELKQLEQHLTRKLSSYLENHVKGVRSCRQ